MSSDWEDYYKILQVHVLAEPEMIKSAYLRLSKKYHPDSKNALVNEEKMKLVNQAYAVLGNTDTRNEYTMRWLKKTTEESNSEEDLSANSFTIPFEPARDTLTDYLTFLSKKEYLHAYELLSLPDKQRLPKSEFVKWQSLVGEVFELHTFSCEVHSMHKDILINEDFFDTCISLHVRVTEENHLMGRTEEDDFYKNIILEQESWRVYLGYTNLKGIIDKFSTLADLSKQKVQHTYQRNTLFYSQKDFLEMAQREQMRFNRYGTCFSMILCTMESRYMEELEQVINRKLRRLDCTCRWNDTTQLILLPETTETSAKKVANKLKLLTKEIVKSSKSAISFGILQQQYATLDELILKLIK